MKKLHQTPSPPDAALDACQQHANGNEFVYFFYNSENRVKIGWAKTDVNARRKTLQPGSPSPLVELRFFHGTRSLETQLHRIFAKDNVGTREWFRYSPDIKLFLRRSSEFGLGFTGPNATGGDHLPKIEPYFLVQVSSRHKREVYKDLGLWAEKYDLEPKHGRVLRSVALGYKKSYVPPGFTQPVAVRTIDNVTELRNWKTIPIEFPKPRVRKQDPKSTPIPESMWPQIDRMYHDDGLTLPQVAARNPKWSVHHVRVVLKRDGGVLRGAGKGVSPQSRFDNFIAGCKQRYGESYTYDRVTIESFDARTLKVKVQVYCKRCKAYFSTNAEYHLRGHGGCTRCKGQRVWEARKRKGQAWAEGVLPPGVAIDDCCT